MGWLETIFRTLLFWLDSIVYKFIPTVYNLLVNIAETSIFSEDVFTLFSNRIYTLLGVFMLFKVSFSILTYIVDPDAFTDKNKGFGKLISNIIITLVLLILTPFIWCCIESIIKMLTLTDMIIYGDFTNTIRGIIYYALVLDFFIKIIFNKK